MIGKGQRYELLERWQLQVPRGGDGSDAHGYEARSQRALDPPRRSRFMLARLMGSTMPVELSDPTLHVEQE